ncbi:MAG: hypothetical protein KKB13_04580, partial [Chloroflexi bacterium]|nr:hypothetical protein [Chloroflexota bacterium]
MRQLWISVLLVMALVAVVAAQCPSGATPTTGPAATQAPAATQPSGNQQQITVAGSTTVQPLAEKLAQAFAGQNPQ